MNECILHIVPRDRAAASDAHLHIVHCIYMHNSRRESVGLRLCVCIHFALFASGGDGGLLATRLQLLTIGLYLLKLTGWHSTTPAKKHGRPLSAVGRDRSTFRPRAPPSATSANWPRARALSDQSQNAPAFHHIFSLQAYAECSQVDYAPGEICLWL
jgi:hypothetical protein